MAKHPTPHDANFKANMQNVSIARDFFKAHLPQAILKKVNLETLRLAEGQFVDKRLRYFFTDVLYTAQFNEEGIGYLYLLNEHVTNPQRLTPFYVLCYQCQILQRDLEQRKDVKGLPPIVGLVFYHGKQRPYPYSTLIEDCFSDTQFAKGNFLKGFQLVDITQMEDSEILTHHTAAVMELLQKHCYNQQQLLAVLKRMQPTLEGVLKIGGTQPMLYNIEYLLQLLDDTEDYKTILDEVVQLLPASLKGETMTIAERLREEGLKKGREEVREEFAKYLLSEGKPIDEIAKTTHLTLEQIAKLRI